MGSFKIFKVIALGMVVIWVLGCSSAKKSSVAALSSGPGQPKAVVPTAPSLEVLKAAKDQPALVAHALTSLGDNRSPRFSPDGSKLLFISSARPSHRQAQVYELDLLRMTERRVTFHDGDDEGASWNTNTRIVYSSVTDEMKEDLSYDRIKSVYDATRSSSTASSTSNGARNLSHIVNGGEIYLQRLDGRAIERITDVSGPDLSPTSDSAAKGTRIIFVSSRSGDPRLYLYDGSSTRAVSHGPDASPAFSYDGKLLAWERALPAANQSSQIFMTSSLRDATPLTSPGFRDQQPGWSAKADAVLFSSNRAGKYFGLYSIDRQGSCLKRLTEVQGDLTAPSMSPDGSKIAFVTKVNGQNQIYVMDNHTSAVGCEPPPLSPSPSPSATPSPAVPKPTSTPAAAPAPKPAPTPTPKA